MDIDKILNRMSEFVKRRRAGERSGSLSEMFHRDRLELAPLISSVSAMSQKQQARYTRLLSLWTGAGPRPKPPKKLDAPTEKQLDTSVKKKLAALTKKQPKPKRPKGVFLIRKNVLRLRDLLTRLLQETENQ